jgi:hypothetical protein
MARLGEFHPRLTDDHEPIAAHFVISEAVEGLD